MSLHFIILDFKKDIFVSLFLRIVLNISFRLLLYLLWRYHPDWKRLRMRVILWTLQRNINSLDIEFKLCVLLFRYGLNNDFCFLNIRINKVVKHWTLCIQKYILGSCIWNLLIISKVWYWEYNMRLFWWFQSHIKCFANLKFRMCLIEVKVWFIRWTLEDDVFCFSLRIWLISRELVLGWSL